MWLMLKKIFTNGMFRILNTYIKKHFVLISPSSHEATQAL